MISDQIVVVTGASRDPDSMAGMCRRAIGKWGAPHLVVANAGRLDALHGRFLHAGIDLDHLDGICARADEIAREEERILTMKGFSL